MANHLTPGELADAMRMERQEVVAKCLEMGVPILDGRIDKSLFKLSLERHAHEEESSSTRAA